MTKAQRKEKEWSYTEAKLLYIVETLFKNESEVKTFTDKQKLTELVARRPAIQEILKAEMKGH